MQKFLENSTQSKISTQQLPPCFPVEGQALECNLLAKGALAHCFLYLRIFLIISHNLFEYFLGWLSVMWWLSEFSEAY